MNTIILAILMGLLAGVLRGILGYFKNSGNEVFEWQKFLRTIVIMGITGFVIGLFSSDWKTAFAMSFIGGIAVNDLISAYLTR